MAFIHNCSTRSVTALNAAGIAPKENVIFITASNAESTAQVINTCVVECNNSANKPHQCAAYYLSAVCALFPGIKVIARELMSQSGYKVVEINETQLGTYAIEMQAWIDTSTVMVVVGQLILTLYKNIEERNFNNYFQTRAQALKGIAGVPVDLNPEGGDIVLSFDAAGHVSKICGSSSKLKIAILSILVHNRSGEHKLNTVCNYLCEIISWVGMSSLVFVFEELCLARSPVLADPRIRLEVKNLYDAYNAISEKAFPQFYRILYPTESAHVLRRSRFPVIIEVARRVRSEHTKTVGQFRATTNTEISPLVAELVQVHKNHFEGGRDVRVPRMLKYLFGMEQDEELPDYMRFQPVSSNANARNRAQTGNPPVNPPS